MDLWTQVGLVTGGIVGIAAVIKYVVTPVVRFTAAAVRFADVSRIVIEEFTPNHGSSIKDRVQNTHQEVQGLQASMIEMTKGFAGIRNDLEDLKDLVERTLNESPPSRH